MKTNQWLAYFVEEHRADFVGVLRGEVAARGWPVPDAALNAWVTALHDDFDADTQERTLPELHALVAMSGQPDAAVIPFWDQAEKLLTGYISAEPDLSAGAKRLAHLRLSTFGNEIRQALRETS
jgi:hypothetical protein